MGTSDTTGNSGGSTGQPGNPSGTSSGTPGELKTLSLVKGENYFCFRYEVGQEGPRSSTRWWTWCTRARAQFDWFDAAILSHQLGRHLAKELKSYMPKKVA